MLPELGSESRKLECRVLRRLLRAEKATLVLGGGETIDRRFP